MGTRAALHSAACMKQTSGLNHAPAKWSRKSIGEHQPVTRQAQVHNQEQQTTCRTQPLLPVMLSSSLDSSQPEGSE
jgi:hypothetical protein